MQTRQDIAEALKIEDKRLRYILYVAKDRLKYRQFEISKKAGGVRVISAPSDRMLWLQRQVYRLLETQYIAKPCVQGFVPERSIVTNARLHLEHFSRPCSVA